MATPFVAVERALKTYGKAINIKGSGYNPLMYQNSDDVVTIEYLGMGEYLHLCAAIFEGSMRS